MVMITEKILFGAAYYDEYMPYDRIETDLQMMQAAGMNTIRIAESTWSTLEPQDDVFDYTHLERMLTAAEKYGMNVIVGTPTYAIPPWLAAKYPDILAVTKNGRGLYGHRQNMDITHPGYLFHCERVIRRLLEYVAKKPCVIGYQIDNETKSYDTSSIEVQQGFVSYLKEQFPDLEEFNKEFGLDYWSNRIERWEDFPDVRGTINASLSGEFRRYQRKLVTDFFHWQIQIVNQYRLPHQFITHNFDFGWTSHSFGLQPEVDQSKAACSMDIAGADIYHPSGAALTGAEIQLCGSIARGIKHGNYLVLETQAQGNPGWLPYPGQLRLQAYSHLSTGANSVMYWHWHSIHNAIESYWKGVLSHNLKENATYREACRIGKELKELGSHLLNLKKRPSIAVLVDNHSLTGMQEFPIHENLTYNHILRWLTDALYEINLEYDIIKTDISLDDLKNYAMVIVPCLYSATDHFIQKMNTYVQHGGHLIMTFKSLFSDEFLKIRHDHQPYGMTECFGMTYDQFTVDDTVTLGQGTFASSKEPVSYFMELLIPIEAKVLATYDHPAYENYAAVTTNSWGLGQATYLGCYFSATALKALLTSEAEKAGISLYKEHFPVIRKEGINQYHKRIIFYLNYASSPASLDIEVTGRELLSDTNVQKGDCLTIEPWGLKILEV